MLCPVILWRDKSISVKHCAIKAGNSVNLSATTPPVRTLGDVAVHEVTFGPRLLRRVDVHPCTSSKIPILLFTFNTKATCNGSVIHVGDQLRGLVSGAMTAIPFSDAALKAIVPLETKFWSVQVKPDRYHNS